MMLHPARMEKGEDIEHLPFRVNNILFLLYIPEALLDTVFIGPQPESANKGIQCFFRMAS